MIDKEFLKKIFIFGIMPLYIIEFSGIVIPELIALTTNLLTLFLDITQIPYEYTNNLIKIPIENGSWGAYISWDSSGWKSIVFMTALLIASKSKGFILIPIIYMINIFRTWFMFFFVSNYGIMHYEFVHSTLWSWGMIFSSLIIWYIWINYVEKRKIQILR